MSKTIYGKEKTTEEIAQIVAQTEASDKKIFPILKPASWVGLKAGALNSELIGSIENNDLEVVIGYGIDTPDNFVFLTQDHLKTMDADQIAKEAFENLENYATEFEFSGALQNKALTSSGNDFSSERILSKNHMMKAHQMSGADQSACRRGLPLRWRNAVAVAQRATPRTVGGATQQAIEILSGFALTFPEFAD